jgi:hypothetical protein
MPDDQRTKPPQPITREALYIAVWEESMTRVARRYGVNAAYLAGVCDVLRIPRPPTGYWIAARYGGAMRRPLLPALEHLPAVWTPPCEPQPVLPPNAHPVRPLGVSLSPPQPAAVAPSPKRR